MIIAVKLVKQMLKKKKCIAFSNISTFLHKKCVGGVGGCGLLYCEQQ